jgi:DNA-binding response OmpR family regulator
MVLVVQDDPVLREEVLVPQLAQHGFLAIGIELTKDLFRCSVATPPDMVILDTTLPDGDGFSSSRWLRDYFPTTGIVLLTGNESSDDGVRSLQHGADAYVPKPVEVPLLIATLHSVYRRIAHARLGPAAPGRWGLGVDGWHLLTPTGLTIPLTRTERALMVELMGRSGALASREQLIGAMTDNAFDYDPHRLDSLIHRIRRKVIKISGRSLPLTSVHGEGYVFTC